MREEESNWFSKWEEELPSPEELMPLSQTLITPDLAMAFDIPNPSPSPNPNHSPQLLHQTLTPPPSSNNNANSAEFVDSAEMGGGGGSGGDGEPARTLKRPRLVWTPQLHKRFVDAVAHLGIKNAVPKTIMQLMSVDGLTRENVASHLQKYRLYLKRMQGVSSGGGGGVGGGDPATDHLFASSPVPAHFLHPGGSGGRPGQEHFLPTFVPYHHHHPAPPPQQQYRQIGHIGLQPNGHIGLQSNGQFEHPFMSPARPVLHHRIGAHNPVVPYLDDVESGTAVSGRKVLTLFPTGDD